MAKGELRPEDVDVLTSVKNIYTIAHQTN